MYFIEKTYFTENLQSRPMFLGELLYKKKVNEKNTCVTF
jgi:hypothetical protein